jgi:hypothetical protein
MSFADRPALWLVTPPQTKVAPLVTFCSRCGEHPSEGAPVSRVCDHCHLGVMLETSADLAPGAGDAFVVLDQTLSFASVSPAAAQRLHVGEDDADRRHMRELLEPADGGGAAALAATLLSAADGGPADLVLRPTGSFGVRWRARFGHCASPPGVVIVFAAARRRSA